MGGTSIAGFRHNINSMDAFRANYKATTSVRAKSLKPRCAATCSVVSGSSTIRLRQQDALAGDEGLAQAESGAVRETAKLPSEM
jgi:hypothetical protein